LYGFMSHPAGRKVRTRGDPWFENDAGRVIPRR
jgi:hypothetical protein